MLTKRGEKRFALSRFRRVIRDDKREYAALIAQHTFDTRENRNHTDGATDQNQFHRRAKALNPNTPSAHAYGIHARHFRKVDTNSALTAQFWKRRSFVNRARHFDDRVIHI